MRYSHWLLFVLAIFCLATVPSSVGLAQAKIAPELQEDDPTPIVAGKLRLTLDPGGHTASIRKVLFTPDGKHLITAANDHSIRIWEVATGKTQRVLYPPGVGHLRQLALSADGETVAVASLYPQGNKLFPVIYLMAFSDGRIERVLQGHTEAISGLAFFADGKRLASGSSDNTIRIWDLAKDQPAKLIPTEKPCIGIAVSPDGNRLAHVESNGLGQIHDLATGKAVAKIKGSSIAWSPDGKTIATGGTPIRLWEPDGKSRKQMLPGASNSIAFSRDSRRLLVTNRINRWNYIFNVQTHRLALKFVPKTNQPDFPITEAWDAAFSPDGTLAATTVGGRGSHQICLWNTEDGAITKQLQPNSWLRFGMRAAWSSDGKIVRWDYLGKHTTRKMSSFNLDELQLGRRLPLKDAQTAVRQQGSLFLEKAGDFSVQVLQDGKVFSVLKHPQPSGVIALTFSGKDRVALADDFENGFYLYDVPSGKQLRRFQHPAWTLAPAPDGRYLLSHAQDQILRIWDPERETPLLNLYVKGQDWILWTEEGYYAASPGGERLMGWVVDNGIDKETSYYPAERFRKQLYRPDVLKLVLHKGSVMLALKAADAARGTATRNVKLDELLPPRAVLTVLDQSKLPLVKLKVRAEASVKEQPIMSLRLLLDGRPVPGKETLAEFADGKQKVELEWSFDLPEGEHPLAVLVRGPDSFAVSQPVRLKYDNVIKLPTLHVLTVGINQYKDGSLDLQYAAPDATALAAALAQQSKGQPFVEVKTRTLLNQQATSKAIVQELLDLRKQVEQQDLVVVFFAGHGVTHKKEYYLLTHETDTDQLEATALSGEQLRKTLGAFKCQVLLMLDACHAAGFGAGKKLSGLGLKPATDEVTRDLTENEYGVAVLCAAMANEKAEGQGGHGLFTQAVLDVLQKKPGVPFNRRNQRVYVHHLHTYVLDEVSARSEDRQHPFLSLPWSVESFPIR